jgi:hypothetical protein
MNEALSPQFKGIWMLIFSLETFHVVVDKHCNESYLMWTAMKISIEFA